MISLAQKQFEWEYYRELREARALREQAKSRIKCAFCDRYHPTTQKMARQWGYRVSKDWRIKLGKWITCQNRGNLKIQLNTSK
jgi:hypothetical protein